MAPLLSTSAPVHGVGDGPCRLRGLNLGILPASQLSWHAPVKACPREAASSPTAPYHGAGHPSSRSSSKARVLQPPTSPQSPHRTPRPTPELQDGNARRGIWFRNCWCLLNCWPGGPGAARPNGGESVRQDCRRRRWAARPPASSGKPPAKGTLTPPSNSQQRRTWPLGLAGQHLQGDGGGPTKPFSLTTITQRLELWAPRGDGAPAAPLPRTEPARRLGVPARGPGEGAAPGPTARPSGGRPTAPTPEGSPAPGARLEGTKEAEDSPQQRSRAAPAA